MRHLFVGVMSLLPLFGLSACDSPEGEVLPSTTGLSETGDELELGCSSNFECANEEVCLPDGACVPAWGDDRGAVGYELRFWLEDPECFYPELWMSARREGEIPSFGSSPAVCNGGIYDWTTQPFMTHFGSGSGWDRFFVGGTNSYNNFWSFCWVEDQASAAPGDEGCGSLSPSVLHAGEWVDETPKGRLHAEIVPVGFE